jgi:DNA-binding NarL/FixJ family response regulator
MNGFYVTFIFLGILLVIVSLICIFLDKKKVFNFTKTFDEKKQELAEIIADAELMIDELNNYSDYIVNQMDLKNEELSRNLEEATQKIEDLKKKAQTINQNISKNSEVVNDVVEEVSATAATLSKQRISTVKNNAAFAAAVNSADAVTAAYAKISDSRIHSKAVGKNEKVIPLSKKYSEVLRYSREGMKSYDIARELNMGKGEVELIIGLKK